MVRTKIITMQFKKILNVYTSSPEFIGNSKGNGRSSMFTRKVRQIEISIHRRGVAQTERSSIME